MPAQKVGMCTLHFATAFKDNTCARLQLSKEPEQVLLETT
jgi:hypothetical protein